MCKSNNNLAKEESTWFVYIVSCVDNSYYVGITVNVNSRILAHNTLKGSVYLRSKVPVHLVYSEEQSNKSSARKREIQIKGWSRKKKELLINGIYKKIFL